MSNDYAGGDKPDLNLPGLQQELLEAVHKARKAHYFSTFGRQCIGSYMGR